MGGFGFNRLEGTDEGRVCGRFKRFLSWVGGGNGGGGGGIGDGGRMAGVLKLTRFFGMRRRGLGGCFSRFGLDFARFGGENTMTPSSSES